MSTSLRIAHLVLAHKNPKQVFRLVNTLSVPEMDFYIHIDGKTDIGPFVSILKDKSQIFFIKERTNIKWGGYGTIQATIDGIDQILKSQISYDYIHVMSGQDFPIKTAEYIINYVKQNYGKEFFDFLHENWPGNIATRYTKYHFINYNFPGKFRLGNIVSSLLPKRSFYFEEPVIGSSNWFMITSSCAQYLLDTLKNDKRLVRYFKHVWGADEFIFVNIISHSPFRDRIDGNGIHYMEWRKNNGHAHTLSINDLPRILESDKLFARKFDVDSDSDVLDAIDNILYGKNDRKR